MSWIRETGQGLVLTVRVVPRASSTRIDGLHGEALKIRLQAPPVEGRANRALLRFLAGTLNTPSSRLSLLAGASARTKRVLVQGLDEKTARQLIGL